MQTSCSLSPLSKKCRATLANHFCYREDANATEEHFKVCVWWRPLYPRDEGGDGSVQQDRVWHGAVPDFLLVLPDVRHGRRGACADAGKHFGRSSGDEDQGTSLRLSVSRSRCQFWRFLQRCLSKEATRKRNALLFCLLVISLGFDFSSLSAQVEFNLHVLLALVPFCPSLLSLFTGGKLKANRSIICRVFFFSLFLLFQKQSFHITRTTSSRHLASTLYHLQLTRVFSKMF